MSVVRKLAASSSSAATASRCPRRQPPRPRAVWFSALAKRSSAYQPHCARSGAGARSLGVASSEHHDWPGTDLSSSPPENRAAPAGGGAPPRPAARLRAWVEAIARSSAHGHR